MVHDLEEEGVEKGQQRGAGNVEPAWEGGPQDHLWRGAEASFWWTIHVTWSLKVRKSNLGQGERSGLDLPAQRDVASPREARPHLCVVPLIKPEAPRLGRSCTQA